MSVIGISGKIGSGKDTIGTIIQYLSWQKMVDTDGSYNTSFSQFMELKPGGYSGVWQIKKFAGKLKQIISLLTGIPVEDLEKQEVKDSYLGVEWNYFMDHNLKRHFNSPYPISDGPKTADENVLYSYKYTVRQMLQEVGTEAMRNQIHPNAWINALFADYKGEYTSSGKSLDLAKELQQNWIITDVRFPNELQAVKDRGGITIRVNRLKNIDRLPFPGLVKEFAQYANADIEEHPSETSLDNAEFDYVIDNNGTIEELIEKVREILIKEKII